MRDEGQVSWLASESHVSTGEGQRLRGGVGTDLCASLLQVGFADATLIERATRAEQLDLLLCHGYSLQQPCDAEAAKAVERVLELGHALPHLGRILRELLLLGLLLPLHVLLLQFVHLLILDALVLFKGDLELPRLLDRPEPLLPAFVHLAESLVQHLSLCDKSDKGSEGGGARRGG